MAVQTESTVSAAIEWLIDNLPANLPVGAETFDGIPTEYPAAAMVAVTGWKLDGAPVTLGGRFQVEEDYDLLLTCRGFAGDSAAAARQLAVELYQAVQATVRADPTFGQLIRVSWIHAADGQYGPTTGGGWACEIEVQVHCEVRLH